MDQQLIGTVYWHTQSQIIFKIMAVKIIRDGQVIHSDKKEVKSEVEILKEKITQQEKVIEDLNNQIKDLKADIRFYKIHG